MAVSDVITPRGWLELPRQYRVKVDSLTRQLLGSNDNTDDDTQASASNKAEEIVALLIRQPSRVTLYNLNQLLYIIALAIDLDNPSHRKLIYRLLNKYSQQFSANECLDILANMAIGDAELPLSIGLATTEQEPVRSGQLRVQALAKLATLFNEQNIQETVTKIANVVATLPSSTLLKLALHSQRHAQALVAEDQIRQPLTEKNPENLYRIYKQYRGNLRLADDVLRHCSLNFDGVIPKNITISEWQALQVLLSEHERLQSECEQNTVKIDTLGEMLKIRSQWQTAMDSERGLLEHEYDSLKAKIGVEIDLHQTDEKESVLRRELIRENEDLQRQLDGLLPRLQRIKHHLALLHDETADIAARQDALNIFLLPQSSINNNEACRRNIKTLIKIDPRYTSLLNETHIYAMLALCQEDDELFYDVFDYLTRNHKHTLIERGVLTAAASNDRLEDDDQLGEDQQEFFKRKAITATRKQVFEFFTVGRNERKHKLLFTNPAICQQLYQANNHHFADLLLERHGENRPYLIDDPKSFIETQGNWLTPDDMFRIMPALAKRLSDKELRRYLKGKKDTNGQRPIQKLHQAVCPRIKDYENLPPEDQRRLIAILKNPKLRGRLQVNYFGKPDNYKIDRYDIAKMVKSAVRDNQFAAEVCKVVAEDERFLADLKTYPGFRLENNLYLQAAKFIADRIQDEKSSAWLFMTKATARKRFAQKLVQGEFENSVHDELVKNPALKQAVCQLVVENDRLWRHIESPDLGRFSFLKRQRQRELAYDRWDQRLFEMSPFFYAKLRYPNRPTLAEVAQHESKDMQRWFCEPSAEKYYRDGALAKEMAMRNFVSAALVRGASPEQRREFAESYGGLVAKQVQEYYSDSAPEVGSSASGSVSTGGPALTIAGGSSTLPRSAKDTIDVGEDGLRPGEKGKEKDDEDVRKDKRERAWPRDGRTLLPHSARRVQKNEALKSTSQLPLNYEGGSKPTTRIRSFSEPIKLKAVLSAQGIGLPGDANGDDIKVGNNSHHMFKPGPTSPADNAVPLDGSRKRKPRARSRTSPVQSVLKPTAQKPSGKPIYPGYGRR